ncbi:hypothetical protein EHV15_23230 [Paenibacillus oralis]|uniref:Uncharacterized protein n=1 Tax=Paenibacillus oralis TaxID=2490856 RepID=A0A3P3UDN9_9BACL|nr:hypothetical protein EHV15_23230 [Paenibacillus oralis]
MSTKFASPGITNGWGRYSCSLLGCSAATP